MLALWKTWSPKPFKLPSISCNGGQLATTLTHLHQTCEINSTFSSTLTTLYVDGLIGEVATYKIFIRLWCCYVCICHDFIANHQITKATTAVVGANGIPLDVIGHTTLVVSLGTFTTKQKFTIVRQLTVDCLLGADFLMNHHAIIDYCNKIMGCEFMIMKISTKARIQHS